MDTTILARRRQQLGLSVREVAARAGVAPSTVSRIERGTLDPTVSTLQRVCDVVGLDLGVSGPTRVVPAEFVAVLEFGELFPRRGPRPPVNLGPIWRRASAA